MKQELYIKALEELVCRAFHVQDKTVHVNPQTIFVNNFMSEYIDVAQSIVIAHENMLEEYKKKKP